MARHTVERVPAVTNSPPAPSASGDIAAAASDAAEHVVEARRRARQMLAGESHLGAIDDWRRALTSSRDAVLVLATLWFALHGAGGVSHGPVVLTALSMAYALFASIAAARATYSQVHYYAAELERERQEIRDDLPGEIAEVRALYAAKGFREPLLTQVVETITADDDRLLKVMMEEELGLSIYHVNHPLLVGIWHFLATAIPALILAAPLLWIPTGWQLTWVAGGAVVMLAVLAVLAARATRRQFVEILAVGLYMGATTCGVSYFLARWLLESGIDLAR